VLKASRKSTTIERTLDDVVCYLTGELGYEKDDPALRWRIWEQFLAGRLKLRRHWKRYLDPEGRKYVWASEVLKPSYYRSHPPLDSLGFDQHGHLIFVGDTRYYTVVEPCDFRAIWPPLAAQAVSAQQPGDKASPDSPKPLAAQHQPTKAAKPDRGAKPHRRSAIVKVIQARLDKNERPGSDVPWGKFCQKIRIDGDAFIGDPKDENYKRGFTDKHIERVTRKLMES
jgi:hypothetical protein